MVFNSVSTSFPMTINHAACDRRSKLFLTIENDRMCIVSIPLNLLGNLPQNNLFGIDCLFPAQPVLIILFIGISYGIL